MALDYKIEECIIYCKCLRALRIGKAEECDRKDTSPTATFRNYVGLFRYGTFKVSLKTFWHLMAYVQLNLKLILE